MNVPRKTTGITFMLAMLGTGITACGSLISSDSTTQSDVAVIEANNEQNGESDISADAGNATDSESTITDADANIEYPFDPAGLNLGAGSRFPALDDPAVVLADDATWMQDDEIILGIEWNGEARAYPVRMAFYHHVVNDSINGSPVLVTY